MGLNLRWGGGATNEVPPWPRKARLAAKRGTPTLPPTTPHATAASHTSRARRQAGVGWAWKRRAGQAAGRRPDRQAEGCLPTTKPCVTSTPPHPRPSARPGAPAATRGPGLFKGMHTEERVLWHARGGRGKGGRHAPSSSVDMFWLGKTNSEGWGEKRGRPKKKGCLQKTGGGQETRVDHTPRTRPLWAAAWLWQAAVPTPLEHIIVAYAARLTGSPACRGCARGPWNLLPTRVGFGACRPPKKRTPRGLARKKRGLHEGYEGYEGYVTLVGG